MAYVGAQPQNQLVKISSQSFNGDGSTTVFSLNLAVNSSEELEVFVDNLQQEPGSTKAYTAAGTTLTFSEAPQTGTGNIYVIFRGMAAATVRLEHDANQALAATTGTFSSTVTGTKFTTSADKTKTELFQINEQTVSNNVTIAATENASVTGPITVATGVTVTVATGGTLVTL
jgi:hypothetical protein